MTEQPACAGYSSYATKAAVLAAAPVISVSVTGLRQERLIFSEKDLHD